MANLYNVPLKNAVQHTLAATLTLAETSTITLDSSVASELQASATMKGLLVVDRVDVNGNLTPTKVEYIAYTGVSGSTVTGLTRGLGGTTAQGHAIGAIVEFVPDVTWAQAINDVITEEHEADGTHKLNTFSNLNAPEGFLINGKIVPSVASNNLTVALKTLAGNDPSASDPIYVRLGGTIRTISSALSVDAGAGTNWLLAGSSETAGIEVDFFVYLGVKTSDSSIKLGFSRIPYATIGSDFATTGSSAKYCRMTGAEYPGDFGPFANIGRFAATLSASPNLYWSVPTFNSGNLIQRPIYETRFLTYTPSYLGTVTLGNGTTLGEYTINGNQCTFKCSIKMGSTSSVTGGSQFRFGNVPIIMKSSSSDTGLTRVIFPAQFHDNGSNLYALSVNTFTNSNQLEQWQTGTGIVNGNTLFTWAVDDGAFVSGSYII